MRRRSATTAVLIGIAVVGLLAFVAAASLWRADGGRWYDVRTASMGRAAPVGSLLLTKPVAFDDVRTGELITFHAPGSGLVYTHRVVSRTADGLHTRGDINPSRDAWTLHDGDLVGRVVWHAPALGYLVRGLPALIVCAALTGMAASLIQQRRRATLRVLAASFTIAALGYVLHPWVGLERIGSSDAPAGQPGVLLRVVSTGLVPINVSAAGGTGPEHHLVSGQTAEVHVAQMDSHGAYSIHAGLGLSLWWWVGLGLICLAPLLWCLVFGLEPVEEQLTERAPARRAEVVGWTPWGDEPEVVIPRQASSYDRRDWSNPIGVSR